MTNLNMSFFHALFDLFYIPLRRFKPIPRAWGMILVTANVMGLFFLPYLEAQVLWISIVIGLVFMVRVYQKKGFVRLLGAGHALWVIVIPWLAIRFVHLPPSTDPYFKAWLVWVIVIDAISLVIDTRDVVLYLKGDQTPYY